jgi:hypothetical protein
MRTALAVVSSITLLTSCSSYYPRRTNEQLAPPSTITLTFASPRDLEATADTVVYALPAVKKVYGRVERAMGDTLVLRVLLLESDQRPPDLPREARLTVVPDPATRVAIRRPSAAKLAGLLAGLVVAGAIAIALATAEIADDVSY